MVSKVGTILRKSIGISAVGLLLSIDGRAEIFRIIHTNDLHSHLDHAEDPERGGYAAVKAKIDELKRRSEKEGIQTLVLDGGDFTEGSIYYLAGRGLPVWKMMNKMGYDAAVIGNHDWLMGSKDFDRTLGIIAPSFAVLGSNIFTSEKLRNVDRYLQPHAEFFKGGLKIAVMGLTTADFLYSWIYQDGFVTPPIRQAQDTLPWLSKNNDVVIALTHIGIAEDEKLVKRTSGLSLVVGGHSHTKLEAPKFARNTRGQPVPIVQTGEHGMYVGNLVVDLQKGRTAQVLSYSLEPIYSNGPRDAEVENGIAEAEQALQDTYGEQWLREVIATSPEPLVRQSTMEPSMWSSIASESMRRAAGTVAAFDVLSFHGYNQPAGDVTRDRIMRLYPRIFEFDEKLGWTVWTANIRGWVLKVGIEQLVMRQIPGVTLAGVTYDTVRKGKRVFAKNIRFMGEPIRVFKDYRVAFPEGIVRGAISIAEPIRLVFKFARNTRVSIWTALEAEFRRRARDGWNNDWRAVNGQKVSNESLD